MQRENSSRHSSVFGSLRRTKHLNYPDYETWAGLGTLPELNRTRALLQTQIHVKSMRFNLTLETKDPGDEAKNHFKTFRDFRDFLHQKIKKSQKALSDLPLGRQQRKNFTFKALCKIKLPMTELFRLLILTHFLGQRKANMATGTVVPVVILACVCFIEESFTET